MSCPELILRTTADISARDILEYLDIEVPPVERPGNSFDYLLAAHFGPIQLLFKEPPSNNDHRKLGNKEPWKIWLHMDTSYEWSTIRTVLMLKLCNHFYREVGGYYFVSGDTGTSHFLVGDDGLVLSEDEQKYYSQFPLSFDKFRFDKLPTP